MNKEVIETALSEALYLLNTEMESVSYEDLKKDYLNVISKIENALIEIRKI
jgi:hypothetical protein